MKKIIIFIAILFLNLNIINVTYGNNPNIIKIKLNKIKLKINSKNKEVAEPKKEKDKDFIKVNFFKDTEIDNTFYKLYNQKVLNEIKKYEEYLKQQNEEKRKKMLEKEKYLKMINEEVKELKNIIEWNEFLYMWFLYLPKNSNFILFKYNNKFYFVPNYKIEVKYIDKEKILDEKDKLIQKYSKNSVNIITDKKTWKKIKDVLNPIELDYAVNNSAFYLDRKNDFVSISKLYHIEAVKIAFKKYLKKEYNNDKALYVFFIMKNIDDLNLYKRYLINATLNFDNNYFLNVGVNHLYLNSFINDVWYRSIPLPLYLPKKQKIIKIIKKQPWLQDLLAVIIIIIIFAILNKIAINKLFYLYKDIE